MTHNKNGGMCMGFDYDFVSPVSLFFLFFFFFQKLEGQQNENPARIVSEEEIKELKRCAKPNSIYNRIKSII